MIQLGASELGYGCGLVGEEKLEKNIDWLLLHVPTSESLATRTRQNSECVMKEISGRALNKSRSQLWKSVMCTQQRGNQECGYYVMRFMYDIVTCCSEVEDLEKEFMNKLKERSFTTDEIKCV
ncbi:uncharacterized protein [Spinacia oleracea]|uniref:Ubiquitin-like protease family profile domain-containing protein n=1 Tax=Spinacia oleracea TaxID=3562 RepID=A0A9R0I4B4_SPIOL|nr:uncharacterized protein LOC110782547 [Spinacia oleracea]